MSNFWSNWVTFIVVVGIIGVTIVLFTQSKTEGTNPVGSEDATGHRCDDGLEAYNIPLPRWWRWMF